MFANIDWPMNSAAVTEHLKVPPYLSLHSSALYHIIEIYSTYSILCFYSMHHLTILSWLVPIKLFKWSCQRKKSHFLTSERESGIIWKWKMVRLPVICAPPFLLSPVNSSHSLAQEFIVTHVRELEVSNQTRSLRIRLVKSCSVWLWLGTAHLHTLFITS